jgi:hypothetical protein
MPGRKIKGDVANIISPSYENIWGRSKNKWDQMKLSSGPGQNRIKLDLSPLVQA